MGAWEYARLIAAARRLVGLSLVTLRKYQGHAEYLCSPLRNLPLEELGTVDYWLPQFAKDLGEAIREVDEAIQKVEEAIEAADAAGDAAP